MVEYSLFCISSRRKGIFRRTSCGTNPRRSAGTFRGVPCGKDVRKSSCSLESCGSTLIFVRSIVGIITKPGDLTTFSKSCGKKGRRKCNRSKLHTQSLSLPTSSILLLFAFRVHTLNPTMSVIRPFEGNSQRDYFPANLMPIKHPLISTRKRVPACCSRDFLL